MFTVRCSRNAAFHQPGETVDGCHRKPSLRSETGDAWNGNSDHLVAKSTTSPTVECAAPPTRPSLNRVTTTTVNESALPALTRVGAGQSSVTFCIRLSDMRAIQMLPANLYVTVSSTSSTTKSERSNG